MQGVQHRHSHAKRRARSRQHSLDKQELVPGGQVTNQAQRKIRLGLGHDDVCMQAKRNEQCT